MEIKNIFEASISNLRDFITFLFESYTTRDKMTILRYYFKSPFHMFNYIKGKKNVRKLGRDVLIKNRYGLFHCGSNLSVVFGCSTLNEPLIRKVLLSSKEGIFIDIGANAGMHSVPLGRKFKNRGKIIAIEPEPENFEILKKNVELNNLNNINIINKGCFSRKDVLTFYLDDIGCGGHSLVNKDIGEKTIKIEVDTLDSILKNLKINRVDLIKIDVEGVEADVLEGAEKTLKKSHPKIIFEAWDEEKLNECKKILNRFNYKIKKITPENYLAY